MLLFAAGAVLGISNDLHLARQVLVPYLATRFTFSNREMMKIQAITGVEITDVYGR